MSGRDEMVILRGVNLTPGAEPEDMISLRMLVNEQRVITLTRRELRSINDIKAALDAGRDGPTTMGEFMSMLIEKMVDRISPVLAQLEDAIDEEEDDLVEGKVSHVESVLVGEHNLYNQVAAVAALERQGLTPEALAKGFSSFGGVKRRQEVIGEPRRITVLDDFAHHPTAVKVTLEALRLRFGKRRMWAIFEPRSATSRRKVFQEAYAAAFGAADVVIVAGAHDQSRINEGERFEAATLVAALRANGQEAFTYRSVEEIVAVVAANALPWDVVAVLSNGGFDGLHKKLIAAIEATAPQGQ